MPISKQLTQGGIVDEPGPWHAPETGQRSVGLSLVSHYTDIGKFH